MINLKSFLKNFGLLEVLVFSSFIFVVIMLTWTATTRNSVIEKANAIKENHSLIVSIINKEIDKCDQNTEKKTSWGEKCSENWSSKSIVIFLLNNTNLKNPYSKKISLIQSVNDPRIQAEGKAGLSTNKGIIFVSENEFSSEPGSEWVISTCVKSPCVAAGNNELISVYR